MNWRIILCMTLATAIPGVQSAAAPHACVEAHWKLPDTVATCTDALALSGQTAEQQANYFFIRGLAKFRGAKPDNADAADDFRQGLRLHPNHDGIQRELSWIALMGADPEAAFAYAQDAVTFGPNNAENWNVLGAAYRFVGEHKSALEAFERAVTLEPSSGNFKANKLSALVKLRRFADAEPDAIWLLSQPPTNTDHWPKVNYANSAFSIPVAARLAYGRILVYTDRPADAKIVLNEAVKLFPHPTTYLEKARVTTAIHTGIGYETALADGIKDLIEAIKLDSTYAIAWAEMASLQSLQNRHAEALESIDKSIHLKDWGSIAHRRYWERAVILRRLKRFTDAVETGETAFKHAKHMFALQEVMRPMITQGYWKGDLPVKLDQRVTDAITACMLDERCF